MAAVDLGGCTINLTPPVAGPAPVASPVARSTTRAVESDAAPAQPTPRPRPSSSAEPGSSLKPSSSAKTKQSTAEPGRQSKPRVRLGSGTSPNADLPWIVEGNRSDGARCVQHAVNVIDDAQIPVDGYYGPVSRRAVEAFQRSIGIKADGEVGPATGRWLATYYDYVQGTGAWARTGCYGHVPARRG